MQRSRGCQKERLCLRPSTESVQCWAISSLSLGSLECSSSPGGLCLAFTLTPCACQSRASPSAWCVFTRLSEILVKSCKVNTHQSTHFNCYLNSAAVSSQGFAHHSFLQLCCSNTAGSTQISYSCIWCCGVEASAKQLDWSEHLELSHCLSIQMCQGKGDPWRRHEVCEHAGRLLGKAGCCCGVDLGRVEWGLILISEFSPRRRSN